MIGIFLILIRNLLITITITTAIAISPMLSSSS